MKKFFASIRRHLSKIWREIKRAIAIIIVIALIVMIIYVVAVMIASFLTTTPAWLTPEFLGVKLAGSTLGAKFAWLGGHALWVYATAVAAVTVMAYMVMPTSMVWAQRRSLAGLKYVGDTAIAVVKIGVNFVGDAAKKLLPWGWILGGAAAFILLKRQSAPKIVMSR